jgi:hypothetical protein
MYRLRRRRYEFTPAAIAWRAKRKGPTREATGQQCRPKLFLLGDPSMGAGLGDESL